MFLKMLHAPSQIPTPVEVAYTTVYDHIPTDSPSFLSFQSGMFIASSGQQFCVLCCMPYFVSFLNKIHIVNVRSEHLVCQRKIGTADSFPEWRSVEPRKPGIYEITLLPHYKSHWALLSAEIAYLFCYLFCYQYLWHSSLSTYALRMLYVPHIL